MPTGPSPANVIFERFTGGDVGRSRPLKSALDQFRGLNVMTYPNGAVGPRPPWQALGLTGLPALRLTTFDCVRNVLNTLSESPPTLVFGVDEATDGKVYAAPATPAGAATLEATNSLPFTCATAWGTTVYLATGVGVGTSYDVATDTAASVAAMPAAVAITSLASRMVTGVYGQIRVSAPDDPTTWPVGNFINIGQPSDILGLYELRNALVILKYDGSVWQITGVPTNGGVLRKVDVGHLASFNFRARASVAGQSNLWWVSGRNMVKFTGAQLATIDRPDIPITEANKALFKWSPSATHVGNVLPLPGDDEFLVVGTLDLLSDFPFQHQPWVQMYRATDQWTRHTLPVTNYRATFDDFTLSNSSADDGRAIFVPAFAPHGMAFVATQGEASGTGARAIKVYQLNTQQEFPLVATGTEMSGGVSSFTLNDGDTAAPTVAQFATAEVWAEDQQYVRPPFTMLQGDGWSTGFTQVRVRSVEIDLSYAAAITPHATYNKFTVSVESVQRDSTAGEALASSTAQAYVAPTVSAPDPDGDGFVRTRVKFQVGDQGWGSGFRVRLANWSGILVHRISCLVDLDGPRY